MFLKVKLFFGLFVLGSVSFGTIALFFSNVLSPIMLWVILATNGCALLVRTITKRSWTYFIPIGIGTMFFVVLSYVVIAHDPRFIEFLVTTTFIFMIIIVSLLSFSVVIFIVLETLFFHMFNMYLDSKIIIYRLIAIMGVTSLFSISLFLSYTESFSVSQKLASVFIVLGIGIVFVATEIVIRHFKIIIENGIIYSFSAISFVVYLFATYYSALEDFTNLVSTVPDSLPLFALALQWYVIASIGYMLYQKRKKHIIESYLD